MNDKKLKKEIAKYKWYHPISFGNGIKTSHYAGDHTFRSPEFGLERWQYIIERNLPDIQGKRVLDLGCNTGINSIFLSRMGAREVVGVDTIHGWETWREQAELTKEALEWRCETKYNVEFIESPMQQIPNLELGVFDIVIALCSIYYISDEEINDLLGHFKNNDCECIILQGNVIDQEGETSKRATPKYLANALKRAGFPYITVDAPLFYGRPVIVGHRDAPPYAPISKRDALRSWLRRLI